MSNPLDSDDDDLTETSSPLRREFDAASLFIRSATGELKSDELLYLYARYKQALDGPCNIPRPGFFDFQGKQKWDAWHSLDQMPAESAMAEYTSFVNQRFPDWSSGQKSEKKSRGDAAAFGARVSTMTVPDDTEDDENDADKETSQAFAWLKSDGLSDRVRTLLANEPELAKSGADSAGQTLLHWAADRADEAACRELLKLGADPNRPDCEGMTSLHSAVASTQPVESVLPVVALLLASGARFNAISGDDVIAPEDLTDNAEVLAMLAAAVSAT